MALRVWLPLNGSVENKGISDITVINHGATVDNNGKIGKCYSFDGDDYIDTGYIESFGVGNFSICTWIYLTQVSGKTYQCIIGNKARAAASVGCAIYWNQSQKKFLWSTADGSSATEVWSVDTFDSIIYNSWHHIAMIRDNNDPKIGYFYLDGERKEIASVPPIRNITSTTSIKIGSITPVDTAYYYTGKVNDVRIYDHALSAKEVKEISQGLVLHYRLDGWSGGAGENLLANSMPLNSLNGWSHAGTNWSNSIVDCDITSSGKCVRCTYTGTTQVSGGIHHPPIDLNSMEDGEVYTLSAYIRASKSCTITFKNEMMSSALSGTFTPTITQSWQRYEVSGTINKAATYYSNIMYVVTSAAEQNMWIEACMMKLEKGSTSTAWTLTPSEFGVNNTKIPDSSGYNNDGNIVSATVENISLDGRYQVCTNFLGTTVDNTSNTITGAQYLYTSLPMPAWSALTLAWWGNNIAYARGGIFETTGTTGNIWEGDDYNTTAIANWDSTFGIYNGSSRVNIFSNFVKDGSWHYHTITFDGANVKYYCDGTLKQTSALTGTLPAITGFKMGLGRAGGVYRQIKQKVSDLRIYATALSAEDILDLYHTSASIDNEKILHSFEFVEDDGNRVDKQGLVHSGLLSSDSDLIKLLYDKKLHIEPDGSVWAHIYHHNRPDLGSFSSTNDFANSVKIDDNRWFNATEIVNSFSSEWEFLIIYNFTQGGTVYKERWIQTKNPETAVFGDVDAADITRVTGSEYKTGTWGGLYKKNGSAYWVMNSGTNGNWWGATGSFSIYQGGIPGYGGTITTTGCNDLYIRIDRFSSTPTQASIGRGSVYTFNDFIEK